MQKNNDPLCVIIFHWSHQHKDEILEEFDKIGKRQAIRYIENLLSKPLEMHYKDHKGKKHYEPMINDLIGRRATIALYTGSSIKFEKLKDELRQRFYHTIVPHKGHIRKVVHTTKDEHDFWTYEWPAWKQYFPEHVIRSFSARYTAYASRMQE